MRRRNCSSALLASTTAQHVNEGVRSIQEVGLSVAGPTLGSAMGGPSDEADDAPGGGEGLSQWGSVGEDRVVLENQGVRVVQKAVEETAKEMVRVRILCETNRVS